MRTIQDYIRNLAVARQDLVPASEVVAALDPAMIDMLSASIGWPSLAEVAAGADVVEAINAGPEAAPRDVSSLVHLGLWLHALTLGLAEVVGDASWRVSDAGVAVVIMWLTCAAAARSQEPLLTAEGVDHE